MKKPSLVGLSHREKTRIRAIQWALKEAERDGFASPAKGGRKFGVVTSTFSSWMDRYVEDGWDGLRDKKATTRCPLDEFQQKQLRAILEAGAKARGYRDDHWTLSMIRKLVEEEFGVSYSVGGMWRFLRNHLGFTCQKPQRVAKERNEQQVEEWIENELPRIQREQKKQDPRS